MREQPVVVMAPVDKYTAVRAGNGMVISAWNCGLRDEAGIQLELMVMTAIVIIAPSLLARRHGR
jgi:hypothetical protein